MRPIATSRCMRAKRNQHAHYVPYNLEPNTAATENVRGAAREGMHAHDTPSKTYAVLSSESNVARPRAVVRRGRRRD